MTIEQVSVLIRQYFPPELQTKIMCHKDSFHHLQEIRCRIGQPLFLYYAQGEEQQAADLA